jgi:DNA-binding NarL/FixJ family response regulator
MDLEMPVMDGFEATRQIKDRHPVTGVVALSMHSHTSAREQAAKAGVDAFVEKVTAIGTLIPSIRQVSGKLSSEIDDWKTSCARHRA